MGITQFNGTVFGGPANRNGFSLNGHPILRALPVDESSGPSRSNSFNPFGVIGDVIGKIWTLPNDVIGLGLGLAGWALGGDAPTLGYNAIQFTNNPLLGSLPDITFGNVINYDTDQINDINPSYTADVGLGSHEMGHTYQYQFLGPLFLPFYGAAELLPGTNPFEVGADNYALAHPPGG